MRALPRRGERSGRNDNRSAPAVVDASMPTAFEVDIAAMVVAIGVVGSTPSSTPCITQASKSSLRRQRPSGRSACTPTISLAWQTENGAVNGDSASKMIHAAQNLESAVGGVRRLPWFRARDIGERLSKKIATAGAGAPWRIARFARENASQVQERGYCADIIVRALPTSRHLCLTSPRRPADPGRVSRRGHGQPVEFEQKCLIGGPRGPETSLLSVTASWPDRFSDPRRW